MSDVIETATMKMAEVTRGQQDSAKAQQFSQSFTNMANGQETLIDIELKKVQLEHLKLDLEFKRLELQKTKSASEEVPVSRKSN